MTTNESGFLALIYRRIRHYTATFTRRYDKKLFNDNEIGDEFRLGKSGCTRDADSFMAMSLCLFTHADVEFNTHREWMKAEGELL